MKKPILIGIISSIAILALLVWATPPVWQLRDRSIKIYRYEDPTLFHVRGPHEWSWQPLDQTSKFLQYAIICAEDARFYDHHGIDIRAILASLRINTLNGKILRGGSTITQQLVKIAFLSSDRSFWRKFREILGAVALESIMTKDQILEWYLNLVPFGHGKIGVREATLFYFEDPPEHLNVSSSIQLSLIIPRPSERSQDLESKALTKFSQKRFAAIARQMLDAGYLTPHLYEMAMTTGNFGEGIELKLLR